MVISSDPNWREAVVTEVDTVTESPIRRMAATIDVPMPDHLPALWHWLFCLPSDPTASLGDDGHRRHERITEAVAGHRRMYAGGSFSFHDRIAVGDRVQRVSSIEAVSDKSGRSGPLAFVTVLHEWSTRRGPAITERQTLVYTDAPPPEPAVSQAASIPDAAWVEHANPDERLLFRFSALTFNTHRIHYDAPHTVENEGYRGLVVHGPLLALLLAGLAEDRLGPPLSYRFRALSPVLVGTGLVLTGTPDDEGAELAAWTAQGSKTMEASFRTR